MRSLLLLAIIAILLGGCSSVQLNRDTLELASSTDHLLTEQVLKNLATFIDNPASLPAHVTVTSGTAVTSNALVPSFPPICVSFSNVASQNWVYSTVTDADTLERLSALYRWAIDGNDQRLIETYPLVRKQVTRTQQLCRTPTGKAPLRNCLPQESVGTETVSLRVVDESLLREPLCIICAAGAASPLYVNPRLKPRLCQGAACTSDTHRSSVGWLRWIPQPGATPSLLNRPGQGDIPVGSGTYGHYALYVDRNNPDRFTTFALAVARTAGSPNTVVINSVGN